jgi:hypothetical protein
MDFESDHLINRPGSGQRPPSRAGGAKSTNEAGDVPATGPWTKSAYGWVPYTPTKEKRQTRMSGFFSRSPTATQGNADSGADNHTTRDTEAEDTNDTECEEEADSERRGDGADAGEDDQLGDEDTQGE